MSQQVSRCRASPGSSLGHRWAIAGGSLQTAGPAGASESLPRPALRSSAEQASLPRSICIHLEQTDFFHVYIIE